jgi:ornithine carbamoyltransferase
VWNGLTTEFHPTQMLADILTMREEFGSTFDGRKLTFMGDAGNNVGNSLMVVCAKLGIDFCACGPEKQMPAPELVEQCREDRLRERARRSPSPSDVDEGVSGAARPSTPTSGSRWASPTTSGRAHQAPARALPGDRRGHGARPPRRHLHALPAELPRHAHHHREPTSPRSSACPRWRSPNEVFEGPRSRVFDEAENRMHTIKAVMYATLK